MLGLDNFYSSSPDNIEILSKFSNFQFLEHNIVNDFDNMLGRFKPDVVINLACPASPPYYQKDPIFTWDTNILGTRNCIKLAKKHTAILLHASTSEVYGNPLENPQRETYWGNVNPIGIRSCYDEGKRAAETLLMDNHRMNNVKIKIFRIFNTYGPFMNHADGRVVSNLITQALQNNNLTIYGDGTQTRSFQYVDDLVNGILKLMEAPENVTGPINLGNPEEFTIEELANLILKLTPEITNKPCLSAKIYKPLPQDDPLQRKPDIKLAQQLLDWTPKIKLRQGLKSTIEYFEKNI